MQLDADLDRQAQHQRPIGVLLLEEHRMLAEALACALHRDGEIEVIATARRLGDVAPDRTRGGNRDASPGGSRTPDVVIVDAAAGDHATAVACRQVKLRWPRVHVVVIGAAADGPSVLNIIRAGADGYLSVDERLGTMAAAVRDAAAGRPIVGAATLGTLARALGPRRDGRPPRMPLTSRELSVLRALASGHGTRRIAADLGIAEGTVRRHVEAIRRKFGVHTRLQAVTAALRHGLIDPRPA